MGGLALAVGLLWLALRGVDAGALGDALRRADLRWVLPLVAVALLSHLVRAWRWRLLLAALPDVHDAPGRPATARVPTLWETFAAVMMGYAVNYALPRAGEVVRTATVSRRTGLDLSAVLGTVVLDRLLDMAMLALGLLTLPFVLRERLGPALAFFADPLRDRVGLTPGGLVAVLAAVLVVGFALALGVWTWWRRRPSPSASATPSRLRALLTGFRDGLATLGRSPHRLALAGATVAMWGLYLLMAYVPFLLLRQAAPYSLGLDDAWSIMLLGSLSMVVPAPGGAGSYHYVTIETLTRLWDVARVDAAAYAVLSHGAQLVVYALAGALCFVLLGVGRRADLVTPPVASSAARDQGGADGA